MCLCGITCYSYVARVTQGALHCCCSYIIGRGPAAVDWLRVDVTDGLCSLAAVLGRSLFGAHQMPWCYQE